MTKNTRRPLRLSSPGARLCLGLSAFALICLIFYLYHEGVWRDVLHYCKYFFEGKRLESFLDSLGPYSAVAFVALQAIQVVIAPIPGEVTGFVGGLLFGMLGGTALSTVGLTLGAVLAFWVARYFGSGFIRKVVKREYIERFDSFMETHKGLNITFVLFLIPGFPKDSLCYLLGLTRMRYLDFILMNVFGRLPGTLILCMQGDAIRHGRFTSFWLLFGGGILLAACLHFSRDHLIRLFSASRRGLKRKKHDEHGETYPIAGKDVK